MRESNIEILPIEIKLNIVSRNNFIFMPIEISSETCVEMLPKFVDILFFTYLHSVEIQSTLIVRVVSVWIDGTIQRKMHW